MPNETPGDDIAKEVARTFGLQNSGWAEGGGLLNNIMQMILGSGNKANQNKASPPSINKPLPRIVPDGKGNLIDLNTNQVVGKDNQKISSPSQSSGLMNDVLGFMKEGLTNFGGDLKGKTDLMNKVAMGKGSDEDLRQIAKLGPILGGILGPIRTADQKQVIKALFRADPEVLQAAVNSPKQFNFRVPTSEGTSNINSLLRRISDPLEGNYGVHTSSTPLFSNIAIHPNTLRGQSPQGQIYGSPNAGTEPNLLSTVLHEVLHGFNSPLANETPNLQANKIVQMLRPHLTGPGKTAVSYNMLDSPQKAMKEALSYLGEAATTGQGSEMSGDIYKAMKPKMFESADRQARDYMKDLLDKLSKTGE